MKIISEIHLFVVHESEDRWLVNFHNSYGAKNIGWSIPQFKWDVNQHEISKYYKVGAQFCIIVVDEGSIFEFTHLSKFKHNRIYPIIDGCTEVNLDDVRKEIAAL